MNGLTFLKVQFYDIYIDIDALESSCHESENVSM